MKNILKARNCYFLLQCQWFPVHRYFMSPLFWNQLSHHPIQRVSSVPNHKSAHFLYQACSKTAILSPVCVSMNLFFAKHVSTTQTLSGLIYLQWRWFDKSAPTFCQHWWLLTLLINDFQIECDKINWMHASPAKNGAGAAVKLFPNKTWQPDPAAAAYQNATLWPYHRILNARRVAFDQDAGGGAEYHFKKRQAPLHLLDFNSSDKQHGKFPWPSRADDPHRKKKLLLKLSLLLVNNPQSEGPRFDFACCLNRHRIKIRLSSLLKVHLPLNIFTAPGHKILRRPHFLLVIHPNTITFQFLRSLPEKIWDRCTRVCAGCIPKRPVIKMDSKVRVPSQSALS